MAVRAMINEEMLKWARQRTLGSIDDAAKRLRVDRAKLEGWEKGESQPTLRQAKGIAKKLKIPFGYLYLSEPPDESLPLPDLRVKPGTPPRDPSPDFLDVLYDAMRKQEWYRDYLINENADPVPFVGSYSMSSPVETVAEDIRRTLQLDDSFRGRTRDKAQYFVRLVEQAESAGVLVMRSSIVGNNTHRGLDPNEFQGFAMSDDLAPLVFVNQSDYLAAQIFTLMHELAHIWTGVSGVSLHDYLERPIVQDEMIQRQADEIAAETLVPRNDLISRWRRYQDIDFGLEELRRHYRVSVFIVLRQTYAIGEIPFDVYQSKYDEFRSQIKGKKKGGGGGYRPLFSRNSTTITTTLLNSVSEGRTLPSEASKLLNVSPTTLYNMQAYLVESGSRG